MQSSRARAGACALLLLGLLLPLAAGQHHHHGASESSSNASELPQVHCVKPQAMTMADMEHFEDAPTYFSHPEHVGAIFAHIALMVVGWVLVLPLAVMLSIGKSPLGIPLQLLFHVFNGLGIFTGLVYNTSTPDLYENNAHHKAGWIISALAVAWTVLGIFNTYVPKTKSFKVHFKRPSYQPVTREAMAEYQRLTNDSEPFRFSADSGQGTERNTESLGHSSRTPSLNSEIGQNLPTRRAFRDVDDELDEQPQEKRGRFWRNSKIDTFLSKHVPRVAAGRKLSILTFAYTVLERFMLPLAFVMLTTGLVTYGGIAKGNHVFNVLAHFIKGGIFFCYGLLTFGRWLGSFSDFGWAWNVKPGADIVGKRKAWIPSAEFTESFVIFIYGASNVFLEHLAAWGQAWSPMDLEHISITIMFFGGGLLGMLIESSTVRGWLNAALDASDSSSGSEKRWSQPKSYVHSLNPIPALVILLLGIMMSSHTQHSLISGQIHKQWGMLFAGFALARGLTYVSFWLKPPQSYLASRPPTEIVASFCLVSGGAIFMASNKDTIHALEVYELDSMFVFTVMMGLTSLLMAWLMFAIALKGWAVKRNNRLTLPSSPSA